MTSDHRQLASAELRDLIPGATVQYRDVIIGNRPLVEEFRRDGIFVRYNHRALIHARYEIADDAVRLSFASGNVERRLFYRDRDGGIFVQWPERPTKTLLAAVIKSENGESR